jgi:hypothetical protein
MSAIIKKVTIPEINANKTSFKVFSFIFINTKIKEKKTKEILNNKY